MDMTSVTKVVAFGDSATDNGNLFSMLDTTLRGDQDPAELGYQSGYSNGQMHIDYMTDAFDGVELDNYAIASARAIGSFSFWAFLLNNNLLQYQKLFSENSLLDTDINLGGQVGRFLADSEGEDLSDTLATVNIGTNDYFAFTAWPAGMELFFNYMIMLGITGSIEDQVTALTEAGVGHIAINTIGSTRNSPITADIADSGHAMYDFIYGLHNKALRELAAEMQALGHDVVILETGEMQNQITADLTAFGFIAPMDTITVIRDEEGNQVLDPHEGYDADQMAYYDIQHTTTAYNAVIGIFEAESLTKEVQILDDGNNAINGTDGGDLVLAKDGDDFVALKAGDDTLIAGQGNDTADGGKGNDLLSGGSGDDVLYGGDNHDVLAGNDGDDILNGGRGNDVLIAGLGNDQMNGDRGNDLFLFCEETLIGGDGTGINTIDGGAGDDTLYLAISEETRLLFEGQGPNGEIDMDGLLDYLNLTVTDIEHIIVVDDRADLAALEADARLADADLWGMV